MRSTLKLIRLSKSIPRYNIAASVDAGEDSRLELPCVESLARRRADRAPAAYAVLAPLQVARAAGRTMRLAFDHDEFRLRPSIDLGDGKELPFAAVGEILLKVGFSCDFTSHFY